MKLTDPETPDSPLSGAIAMGCALLAVLGLLLAAGTGHPGPGGLVVAASLFGVLHAVWWARDRKDEKR